MFSENMVRHQRKLIVGLVFFLVAIAFSPYHALVLYPFGADDASYLSHAFTLGLDFNFRYDNNIAEWLTINGNSAAHPFGPGLLAAPFVALFSILDYIFHHDVIENAVLYQYSWAKFGFVFASGVYFILGVYLYKKCLNILSLNISNLLLVLLCSSFGVLYYVFFRPVMGHSYEFFGLSLCSYSSVYLLDKIFSKQAVSLFVSFGIAISLVLTLLVRPANINVFVLLPIFAILVSMHKNIKLIDYKYQLMGQSVKILTWFVFIYSFVALINLNLYGQIFPSSFTMYGGDIGLIPPMKSMAEVLSAIGFLISHMPQLFNIMFTTEFGLIFASPILVLGLAMLVLYLVKQQASKMQMTSLFVLLFVYLGLPAAIVLFWQSNGSAYGFRFLFCWFPVALIGYSLCQGSIHGHAAKWSKNIVIVMSIMGFFSSTFYAINPTLQYQDEGYSVFAVEGGNAMGYEKQVLKSIVSPTDWLKLVVTRFPGMMGVGVLSSIDSKQIDSKLPTTLKAKWNQWQAQNNKLPVRFYFQSVIFYLFMCLGICFLILSHQKRLFFAGRQPQNFIQGTKVK